MMFCLAPEQDAHHFPLAAPWSTKGFRSKETLTRLPAPGGQGYPETRAEAACARSCLNRASPVDRWTRATQSSSFSRGPIAL